MWTHTFLPTTDHNRRCVLIQPVYYGILCLKWLECVVYKASDVINGCPMVARLLVTQNSSRSPTTQTTALFQLCVFFWRQSLWHHLVRSITWQLWTSWVGSVWLSCWHSRQHQGVESHWTDSWSFMASGVCMWLLLGYRKSVFRITACTASLHMLVLWIDIDIFTHSYWRRASVIHYKVPYWILKHIIQIGMYM